MADEQKIGTAYLEVKPQLSDDFGDDLGNQGSKQGEKFGSGFSAKMKGLIGAGSVFVGNLLANMASQALNALGQFVGDSIKTGEQFDAAMSQVAATMGTTVDQIQDLQEFAQEMGATTAFSANQAAEALNYMALAGYSSEQSMKALPNVLNLAAAGSIDLARASDMVTDAQSALGLSFEDLNTFVDQLAKTASTTNTSVEQLGDAILTVGGTAKMMAGGTNELNQVLGLLADNGIKGSEGGTALRNMLLSLASPTDAASDTLKKLGVSVFDAEGNMRSMQDVMADLNSAMDGMTSEERTQAIANIFNKRDLKSVEALLGTNAERWDEVAAAIDNAQGAAQAMADTQLDNLQGDVTLFQSALEGLQIELFHGVEPALRNFVKTATDGLGGFTSALPGIFSDISAFFFGVADEYDETGNLIAKGSKGIFSDVSGAFSDIQSVVNKIWPTVQKTIGGVLDILVAAFKFAWPLISSIVTGVSQAIEGVVSFVWPLIDTIITNAIDNIVSVIEGLSPLVEFVTGVFNDVASAMENPIESAKNFLSDIPNQIIGFFSGLGSAITNAIGSIHFPTPHVTWENIKVGDFETPIALPHVSWYAQGGIVDAPSLIGVGESGREAIVPLTEPNIAPFADAVAERLNGSNIVINGMTVIADNPEDFMSQLTAFAARTRRQYA